MPVAAVSAAVAAPIRRISAGSRIAPSPILCGKSVAPTMLLAPWTASVPQITGTTGRPSVRLTDAS